MGFLRIAVFIVLCPAVSTANDHNSNILSNKVTGKETIIVKKIPATPVRDQYKTSTCWSFSGISLIESELIRTGKGEFDLSEMFIVRYTYERKAERYIRMHGKTNFAPGGETNDVTDVMKKYGIVPESIYTGLKHENGKYIHSEMDKTLHKYVESVVSDPGKIASDWKSEYRKILDNYLGEVPDSFEYDGQVFTSSEFAGYLDINLNNYIMITSFMHSPYYEPVVLEIPDNWSWAASYNVPLDDFEQIVDSALFNGFSVAWAADISEAGFSFSKGMALAPEFLYSPELESEKKKWLKNSDHEKDNYIFKSGEIIKEVNVTAENRQAAFDNFSTTDDHGMHILGITSDDSGNNYYYVKNSWGSKNPYNGYMLVSKPYFRYKLICVMLSKDALSPEIKQKLSL